MESKRGKATYSGTRNIPDQQQQQQSSSSSTSQKESGGSR
jgi:hypothetical protein